MTEIHIALWKRFSEYYLGRNTKERVLITFLSAAFLFIALAIVILDPINHSTKIYQTEINTLKQEESLYEMEEQAIKEADRRSQRDVLNQNLSTYEENIKTALQDITNFSKFALSPTEMVVILESILKTQANIQLIQLENSAPTPAYEATHHHPRLFKHGFILKVKANYLDVLNYLKELEASPYPLFWEHVRIETEEYPNAITEVLVYTLSESPSFLGVAP